MIRAKGKTRIKITEEDLDRIFPKNPPLELLQFHPNLLIVGTYHGLNDEHKEQLEELVKRSSFVALEWDHIRDIGVEYLHCRPFRKPELINDHLYLGIRDYKFLKSKRDKHRNMLRQTRERQNLVYNLESSEGNEFLFAKEMCLKYGIDYCFVDDIVSHALASVLRRDTEYLFGLVRVESVNRPFGTKNRSKRMIQRVVQKYGPLSQLESRGLLIVGKDHLDDYKKIKAGFKDNPFL